MKKQKLSFTLIEILVVIGIILILAAIILPAVNGAVKKADQTKAKAQITTLVNAIKQYEATYGYLPNNASWYVTSSSSNENTQDYYTIDPDHYEDFIKCLQADTSTDNPKKQQFLDVVGNTPGEYNDPWGNKFGIMISRNTNKGRFFITKSSSKNKIKIDGLEELENNSSEDPKALIYQSVIVWSEGASSDAKDNVYSFPVVWDKDNKKYKIGK